MMRRPKQVENKHCLMQRRKTRIWSRRDGDSIVYMHRNRRNNKIYIGYTTRSCFGRWTYKEYKRQRADGSYVYFYNALIKEKELYEKAGIQSDDIFLGFESRILVGGLSKDMAKEIEAFTISFLKERGHTLYNLTDGGESNPMDKPEARRKLSEALKGRTFSEETCRKISAATPKKTVEALDPHTGRVVHRFESTREAERAGFHHGDISDCCNNKQHTYRGLIWRVAKTE